MRAHSDRVSALIAGGGPVGLTLGLLLDRRGIDCLVVERRLGTSVLPRATGVNVRSMEIFRGLEEQIRSVSLAGDGVPFLLAGETVAGPVRARAESDQYLSAMPPGWPSPAQACWCALDQLEPLLLAAVRHRRPEEDDRKHLHPVWRVAGDHRRAVQERRAGRDHPDALLGSHLLLASAGASAGYLTVSEIFPLEVRAKAIAVFFAVAQCFGAFGSRGYGHLIGTGQDRNTLFVGYLVGADAMIIGGIAAIIFGVNAEGKPMEDVARPLSVIGKPPEAIFRAGADGRVLNPSGGG